MALSLSNESKNNISLANEAKGPARIWNNANYAWKDAGSSTWNNPPFFVLSNESKNTVTITNENKN